MNIGNHTLKTEPYAEWP